MRIKNPFVTRDFILPSTKQDDKPVKIVFRPLDYEVLKLVSVKLSSKKNFEQFSEDDFEIIEIIVNNIENLVYTDNTPVEFDDGSPVEWKKYDIKQKMTVFLSLPQEDITEFFQWVLAGTLDSERKKK